MPHIQAGKLRVLAVTGKQRLASLPEVPTTAEAGLPKVDATSWFALFAPAATPKAVIDKLAADTRAVVQSEAFKKKAEEQGATADYQDPAQLAARVKADLANWAQVVKSAKIEAE
jgi:tripartite-type tricarboxylate transporter receptor subunit TctC